jgi:hypothetical protein
MKRVIFFIFILFSLSSCRQYSFNFNDLKWYFYRLPSGADIYFKIDAKYFLKFNNLFSLYRLKQLSNYLNKYGINIRQNVKKIYGAVNIAESENSTYIFRGKFSYEKINMKLKRTHTKYSGKDYSFYKSKLSDKFSVGLTNNNDKLMFSNKNKMRVLVPGSREIFHTLNILKRVDFNSHTWALIICTENVKNFFKQWIELETLSLASFYSISIKTDSTNTDIFSVDVRIYVEDSTYTEEIITTLKNYFIKMKSIYSLINESFYNLSTYIKGNFARITFAVNLSSIKVTE